MFWIPTTFDGVEYRFWGKEPLKDLGLLHNSGTRLLTTAQIRNRRGLKWLTAAHLPYHTTGTEFREDGVYAPNFHPFALVRVWEGEWGEGVKVLKRKEGKLYSRYALDMREPLNGERGVEIQYSEEGETECPSPGCFFYLAGADPALWREEEETWRILFHIPTLRNVNRVGFTSRKVRLLGEERWYKEHE